MKGGAGIRSSLTQTRTRGLRACGLACLDTVSRLASQWYGLVWHGMIAPLVGVGRGWGWHYRLGVLYAISTPFMRRPSPLPSSLSQADTTATSIILICSGRRGCGVEFDYAYDLIILVAMLCIVMVISHGWTSGCRWKKLRLRLRVSSG